MNRHLWLLSFCQGLLLTNNIVFIAINGLVGLQLAPAGWMATLPITGYVLGTALSAPLVARLQARLGRRRAFQLGLVVAVATALLCFAAVQAGSFWGLVGATLLAGFYAANGGLYRFAGPELVAPAQRDRAVSLVLAGGILGAFAGPNLAAATRDWLAVPFAGAYLALAGVALLALAAVSAIRFPPHQPVPRGSPAVRPLAVIARQPVFIVAVTGAALGYGVMNLLMAATPLAMQQCGLPFEKAALVLEWHVLAMFLPGFFTGSLIQRIGALPVMVAGAVLSALCVAVALAGVELMHFLAALMLLGLGWNFLYTGGTTLFMQTYRPEEKTTAQGAMDFCVAAVMALTSFAAGALVTTQGWWWLNAGSLLPLGLVGGALLWLALRERRGRAPAAMA